MAQVFSIDGDMKRVQKYHRWNPVPKELEQQVIEFYLAGNSALAASKKFGVSTLKVLKRNGIRSRSKKIYDTRNKNKEKEIIALYQAGKSVAQVMKIVGVGEKAVDNCLARNSIKKRSVGWQNGISGFYRPKSKGKEKEIIAMYLSGISADDTGIVFGVCASTVRYVLKNNGIKIRPCGISKGTKNRGTKGGISRTKEYQNKKQRKYKAERRLTDPLYKLTQSIRARMTGFFRRARFCKTNNIKKILSTVQMLGADKETVFKHIESQFKEGMNWDNYGYGKDKWHVDHKEPLCSALDENHLMRLMHFSNLQPLWQTENQKKGGRYAS